MNEKTIIRDTGANIAAAPAECKFAICTSTGSGFTVDHVYFKNSTGTWVDVGKQDNLYVLFRSETTVAKQRVIEWFSGSALNTHRWTQTNEQGASTFAMVDSADEGFGITTGSTNGDASNINFNNKRAFSATASEMIAVVKRVGDQSLTAVGISNSTATPAGSHHNAFYLDSTLRSFKALLTTDGTMQSITDSDIAIDTNWHTIKIVCSVSDIKLYIDGVLKVTKTTNRPSSAMQPIFRSANAAAVARESRIRYGEWYST